MIDTIISYGIRIVYYIKFVLVLTLKSAMFSFPAWIALLPVCKFFEKDFPNFFVVLGVFSFLRLLYIAIFIEGEVSNDTEEDFYYEED